MREVAQHPRQFEPVQVGHPHVEEDPVVGAVSDAVQGLTSVARAFHFTDPGGGPQQPGQVLERQPLVVDGQQREPVRAHAATPAAARPTRDARSAPRLGTDMITVVPAPGRESIRRP